MPRASHQTDRDIADYWTKMIRKGLDTRKTYTNAAKTVEEYLGPIHKELFERDDVRTHYAKVDGSSAVSIPKIVQMRNALGPRLYQVKPVRSMHARTSDLVLVALGIVLEFYVNYTTREAKFAKHQRKATDDGLIRGRSMLRQTFDSVREIVTSVYLSSLDFVFDPDFFEIEDGKWIAFRVVEPYWETRRRVTEKWRTNGLEKNHHKNTETDSHSEGNHEQRDGADRRPQSADLTTYWVVLSKMGRGLRGLGMDDDRRRKDDKDFVRLEIVLDHDVPIAEGDWEVPLYLDKDWPVSYADPVEPMDRHWPDSIPAQILPSQQSIDLLSSTRLQGSKNRDRLIVFSDASVMEDVDVHAFKNGGPAEFISINLPSGKMLQDAIMVPQFGEGSQGAMAERDYHERQIENTTGVTDTLSGGHTMGAVERSATATAQRTDASNVRVQDLKHKIEELTTDAGRKEAIIARLMLDAEDVEPAVPPGKIGMFYISVMVPGGAEIPIRDTRTPEDRQKQPMPDVLTLEQIAPEASTFYLAPETAYAGAVAVMEALTQPEEPRLAQLADVIMSSGVDPETGLPPNIQIKPVRVETVWQATAGMSPKELMREFGYEMATGSGHKMNKEAEQQNADFLVQNVLSVALQTGDIENANKILSIRDEAFDIPLDQRVQLVPPPPPAPEGGPPEQGAQ